MTACECDGVVVEKNMHKNKPGAGQYLDRKQLDYFGTNIGYNNKFKNPKTSTFGGEKRFSFPSK